MTTSKKLRGKPFQHWCQRLASPETERVMADVKNFTDTAVVMRSVFDPL